MHDVEGGCLHKVHLKSFNARLAIDYPAYFMVICQFIDKLKLVLLFAAQYLTEWVKMTERPHLFELIIACISINYRSIV